MISRLAYRRSGRPWLVAACALALSACAFNGGGGDATDAGSIDGPDNRPDAAAVADAAVDGPVADASPPDAGPPDASPPDASPVDAAPPADAAPPPPLIEGLTTLAGAADPGEVNGSRDVARFNNPVNVVLDSDGSILLADQDNGAIRRVTVAGEVTTVVPKAADFDRPFGLVRVGTTLYVQTDLNTAGDNTGALWAVDLTDNSRTLMLEETDPLASRYRGLAALSDGRLVLCNYVRHAVYLFDPSNSTKTLLAGAEDTAGFVDGTGAAARFDQPYGAVVLAGDIILVADFNNHRIRRITTAGVVTTFAGAGTAGNGDGALLTATFNNPQGLALDSAGNVYVSEPGNSLVRKISGGNVSTIAGNGVAAYADNADPLAGSLFGLEGLAVGAGDVYLYVADGNRGNGLEPFNRLRRVTLP